MNCVELLCDFLRQAGVNHIFGVPGYANCPITLATHKFPGMQTILTKHEGGAAWMAYGYAMASGGFGACTGTSGPGTTNLLAGVIAAYANSVPMLVVTGQIETHKFGRRGFQEMSGVGPRSVGAVDLLKKMTKMSILVESARSFPDALQLAYATMMSGRRGPVHLNIPVDVQKTETGCAGFRPEGGWQLPVPGPDQAVMARLRGLLEQAKAPLMVIGRGCLPQRQAAMQAMARLNLPFATTIQAKGISGVKSRFNFGTVGVAGSPRCNEYIREAADLIIGVGTSFNEFTVNAYEEGFIVGKTTALVNIDPAEFADRPGLELPILSDAGAFLAAFNAADMSYGDDAFAATHARYLSRPTTVATPLDYEVPGKASPMAIIEELRATSADDTIFTADSGNNAIWVIHLLAMLEKQDFQMDINTGCMGAGVVSSIGAKLAAPGRPVVSVCGDGGFMMNGIEVTTAADYGVPVTWLVFNDQKLGMVEQGQHGKYGVSLAASFNNCDIAAMARSFGAEAVEASSVEEVRAALVTAGERHRPYVIDVRFNDLYLPTVYGRAKGTPADQSFREFLNT